MTHLYINQSLTSESAPETVTFTALERLYTLAMKNTLDATSAVKGWVYCPYVYRRHITGLVNSDDNPTGKFKGFHIRNDGYYVDLGLAAANTMFLSWMNQKRYGKTDANGVYADTTNTIKLIGGIFGASDAITSLDFTDVNTVSVTSFYNMCYKLAKLEKLTLGDFKTDSATLMSSMFEGCPLLTEIPLSTFDTSSVTDMSRMFRDCSGLQSLTLPVADGTGFLGFSGRSVKNMSDMFNGCTALTRIDNLDTLVTPQCTSMMNMFKGCASIPQLNLSGMSTGLVTNMKGLFSGCTVLSQITLPSVFDTSSVTDFSYMYDGCAALKSTEASPWSASFDTRSAADMSYMYNGCAKLEAISFGTLFKTPQVMNMSYMFSGCTSLTKLDLSGFTGTALTKTDGMFSGCELLKTIDMSNMDMKNVTGTVSDMFTRCKALTQISVLKDDAASAQVLIDALASVDRYKKYSYDATVNVINLTSYANRITVSKATGEKATTLTVNNYGTDNATVYTIDYSQSSGVFTYPEMIYSLYRFASGQTDIQTVSFSSTDTDKCVDMGYMFDGCSGMTSVDMSGFDTGKVTGMRFMFNGCTKLTSINTGDRFLTSKVTDMQSMYAGCAALTSLDLSKYDTHAVTTFNSMFNGCAALASLTFGSGFSAPAVTDMTRMFSGCAKLPAPDLTGLTTPKLLAMQEMFKGCATMAALDLHTFNTQKVTSLAGLFSGCTGLTGVTFVKAGEDQTFDTQSVLGMGSMFEGCTSLASLDLTGVSMTAVTSADRMFYGCKSLASLTFPALGTLGASVSVTDMFTGCGSLSTVSLTGTPADASLARLQESLKKVGLFDWDSAAYTLTARQETGGNTAGFMQDGTAKTTLTMNTAAVYTSDAGTTTKLTVPYTKVLTNLSGFLARQTAVLSADLSGLKTGSVEDMSDMFAECTALTSINFGASGSYIDTSKVKDFSGFLSGCTSMKSFDFTALDLSAAEDMSAFFGVTKEGTVTDSGTSWTYYPCRSLTSVTWPASKPAAATIKTMSHMFEQSVMSSFDLAKFNTAACEDMSYMFDSCYGIAVMDLAGVDMTALKTFEGMFRNCSQMTAFTLKGSHTLTPALTNISEMFSGCTSMSALDLSGMQTSGVLQAASMFLNCYALTDISMTGMDLSKATNLTGMFSGCSNLVNADFSGMKLSASAAMDSFFRNCTSLKKVKVTGCDTVTQNLLMTAVGNVSITEWEIAQDGTDTYIREMTPVITGLTIMFPAVNVIGHKVPLYCRYTGHNITSDLKNTVVWTLTETTGAITLTSETEDFQMDKNVNGAFVTQTRTTYYMNVAKGTSGVMPELTVRTADGTVTATVSDVPVSYADIDWRMDNLSDLNAPYIYAFMLNDNGYMESNNKGVDQSAAVMRMTFSSPEGTLTGLTFDCENSGEQTYDFGMVSNVDMSFVTNNWVDGNERIKYSFRDTTTPNYTDAQVSFTGLSGSDAHTIYFKYRKDASGKGYQDCMRFRITDMTFGA